jgi:hypothetical protein
MNEPHLNRELNARSQTREVPRLFRKLDNGSDFRVSDPWFCRAPKMPRRHLPIVILVRTLTILPSNTIFSDLNVLPMWTRSVALSPLSVFNKGRRVGSAFRVRTEKRQLDDIPIAYVDT